MKELVVLILCAACCMVASKPSKRELEQMKRELELRIIERELARDQGMELDDTYDELEARYLSGYLDGVLKMRDITEGPGCFQGDFIFVVGSYSSIEAEKWNYVLESINEIVDRIGVHQNGTRVGMLTFGEKAHIQFHLNEFTDPAPMKARISASGFLDENRNTSGGIYVAMTQMFTVANGDRPSVPNIMIIVTDDVPTYDRMLTIQYANEAKAKGILIIVIQLESSTRNAELEGMASVDEEGEPMVLQFGTYGMLNFIIKQLVLLSCRK